MKNRNDYSLADINTAWQAVDRATLLFVLHKQRVLLIRKKRGLGAGKINGPGGKLENNETFAECALREVNEELGITAFEPTDHGRLRFQFCDGYSIDVRVFVTSNYAGEPRETEEAIPLWFELDAIPYDEMWEDDQYWLPRVLRGDTVDGRFIFDADKMLDHEIRFRLLVQFKYHAKQRSTENE